MYWMFIISVTFNDHKGIVSMLVTEKGLFRMDDNTTKPTMTVPEAGRKYFGLGKNGSYDAAKRGDIPTIKIGSRLFVPVIALERMLSEVGSEKAT
jgi:hypothetical protein